MLKYLRIAVTGVTACVLLIALWVRSYWRLDIVEKRTGFAAVQICSVKGRIAIAHLGPRTYVIGKSYLSFVAGDAADWRKGGVFGFTYLRMAQLQHSSRRIGFPLYFPPRSQRFLGFTELAIQPPHAADRYDAGGGTAGLDRCGAVKAAHV